MSSFLLVIVALTGAVTDIERAYHKTLRGEGASVADMQAAWASTMGLRCTTGDGVIASGNQVSVQSLDIATLSGEIPEEAEIRHYVELSGQGPEPLHLYLPRDPHGQPTAVYRRVEPGLFVEPAMPPVAMGGYWHVKVNWPGRFVVHAPQTPDEGKVLFPEYPPAEPGPERKWRWDFYRVGADEVDGSIPIILIHGSNTDRWSDLVHWARFSPEAGNFRSQFQLWNFSHKMSGVNAAIGFDPSYPGFEESIIAYLYRFVEEATAEGARNPVTLDLHTFPAEGPIAIITNSHGALKARAFMINFPDYGDRVIGAVTLGGPHMGTPLATLEWLRHTVSRFGLLRPNAREFLLRDALETNYISMTSQGDFDMGWLNADRGPGYGGIPYTRFNTWTGETGMESRVLSPRDANITGARDMGGFNDPTFDPASLLSTYCGGLEVITPEARGELYMDRFFLYGGYLHRGRGWLDMMLRAGDGHIDAQTTRVEGSVLRAVSMLMGFMPAEDADWPVSPYRLNDGFVPLQSELMLDGRETRPVFKTTEILGWRVPILPFTPDMEVIAEHTLANPDRIRIWPGWSHLDLTTGRYNRDTMHSPLYVQVAADLLSVVPAE